MTLFLHSLFVALLLCVLCYIIKWNSVNVRMKPQKNHAINESKAVKEKVMKEKEDFNDQIEDQGKCFRPW